jgi:hypothetical protein
MSTAGKALLLTPDPMVTKIAGAVLEVASLLQSGWKSFRRRAS